MDSANHPTVFLQVYSGRPDPSWPLEGEALNAVAERVRAAREQPAAVAPPAPVLGYRGFLIENPTEGELPLTTTVWRGLVTAVLDGAVETFRDQADLEGFLLAEARDRGHREVLRAAGAPPDSSPQTD
jgi:hypothetical protein